MYSIAVFVSGGGTNLQAIIDRIADGGLPGIRIAGVIASKPGTFAEQRAVLAGIRCTVVNRKDFKNEKAYDEAMLEAIRPLEAELIVLAGFLSKLGPQFVETYRNRIINIHPSLIPAFCGEGIYGLKPHELALEYGVRVSGATVHIVNDQYDNGPIIMQKAVPVRQDDTPQILQRRVMLDAEQIILPQAIALYAAGRIKIDGRRTFIEGD